MGRYLEPEDMKVVCQSDRSEVRFIKRPKAAMIDPTEIVNAGTNSAALLPVSIR